MDRRERRGCPICGKGNFLKLHNHLAQMHGLNAKERQQYLENAQSDINYSSNEIEARQDDTNNSNIESTGDIFSMEEEDVFSTDESICSMEENSDNESDDDDDDDDERRMWLSLRDVVVEQYADKINQIREKLRAANPNASESELKHAVREKFKDIWINDAAEWINYIITMYEFFQTDPYMEKIMKMRDRLNEEDDSLTMAIDAYKLKLGSLFSCPFAIPK